jgi:hypothetical protein
MRIVEDEVLYLEYLTIDEFWKQYYMNKYLNKVAA